MAAIANEMNLSRFVILRSLKDLSGLHLLPEWALIPDLYLFLTPNFDLSSVPLHNLHVHQQLQMVSLLNVSRIQLLFCPSIATALVYITSISSALAAVVS